MAAFKTTDAYAPTGADVPNRLLVRGRLSLPKWLFVSTVDWRNGTPYSVVNETLDFVGFRNQSHFFKAYFVEARNIGDLDVLVDIAQSVGLPAVEARQVLTERRFKDAVDADWAKSRQWGVTGVPTFVAARYGVVGAQPYEVLEQLMEKAGARRRA